LVFDFVVAKKYSERLRHAGVLLAGIQGAEGCMICDSLLADLMDSILRSVYGASLHHFSGLRQNDGLPEL
jgi:hypothetical protein